MTQVLFVHGALVRDGAWWWRPVAGLLQREDGRSSRAVPLPSCGEAPDRQALRGEGPAGLAEDAASLHAALDAVADAGDDAVVVAHSYGGTVAAEGADHPAVRHLLYITSYLPDAGASQASIMAAEAHPVSVRPVDGALQLDGYDADSFADRFLQDVSDPALRQGGWDRVTAQSMSAFTTPTTRAAWQGRPSTYLVCAQDRSTSVELQRVHAARAGVILELPTGHHPFLSRPDLVAEQVRRILTS